MHRTLIKWVGLFLFASLLLPACGSSFSGSPTLAPTTIVFVIPTEMKEQFTHAIEGFKQVEPNITIEIDTASYMGQPGDVRLIAPNYYDPNRQGQPLETAIDLSPFFQQDASFNTEDFYPGLFDAFSREGKQLALPLGVDPFVLYYNQELFDQRQVPYPTGAMTWDDFKTTAMRLTDPSTEVYGYLPMEGYIDAIFFSYQHGANLMDGSHPMLDTPESIEALEWYSSLFNSSAVAPSWTKLQQDYGNAAMISAIYKRHAAMWIGQFSQISGLEHIKYPFAVGIAPLPKDQTSFTVSQFTGVTINKDTKSPEACWRWIAYLSHQPLADMVPARRSVAQSQQYGALVGKDQAAVAQNAVQDSRLISTFDFTAMRPVMEAYLSAVYGSVDGMLPPAETLSEAQKKLGP